MKLLIFKAYYEPETAASMYLTTNLLEDFATMDFDIELYVPMPTRGLSRDVYNKYKHKKYEEQHNGKVRIHRFSMFREGKNPLQRAFRYVCSSIVYFYKGLLSKDIDVIYVGSTPPIMGLLVAVLKKFKKVPFVYSLQDIFPDSLVSTGLTKEKSFLWKIGRLIENYTYKNADKIIVISDDFKQNLINKGVPKGKIEVIYNWVDENAIVPIDRNENILFDNLELRREEFYVVYAGNLGHAQNIEVILNAARELLNYKDIKFIIFGGGLQENYYKDIANGLKLNNTIFFPLQPYSMVSNVYSLGDISIVSCKKGLGKSAMPSKTWSIMSAATAVIANFDEGTDLHRIIDKNNVGVFTDSGNVEGLRDAILKLYFNRQLCLDMGNNGREFIVNNLTRKAGTKKYINVIKDVGGLEYV